MKKVIIAILMVFGFSFVAEAQVYAHRQYGPPHGFHQRTSSKELTKKERMLLKREQTQLKRMRKRALADCRMTPAEGARIHQKQHQIGRHMRRFRNN
jgi:hypothetical protein